jgi:hypothetical protein
MVLLSTARQAADAVSTVLPGPFLLTAIRMCATCANSRRENSQTMPLATAPLNTPTLEWPKAAPAILWTGLIAGAMDITAAFIYAGTRGASPGRVLQGVASGLLGPASFQGGAATMALGLMIHFFIAFSATTVFYLASRRLAFMTDRAVLTGVFYGVAVYLIMYWGVVPLYAVRRGPFSWTSTIIAIITHIFCVGLPISLGIKRFSR